MKRTTLAIVAATVLLLLGAAGLLLQQSSEPRRPAAEQRRVEVDPRELAEAEARRRAADLERQRAEEARKAAADAEAERRDAEAARQRAAAEEAARLAAEAEVSRAAEARASEQRAAEARQREAESREATRSAAEAEARARVEAEARARATEEAQRQASPRPSVVDPCADSAVCTLVPIFFGTDRKRADTPRRVEFGAERADALQLGQALVSVPNVNRQPGEVLRPTLIDRVFRGVAAEGDPARHFTILAGGVHVFADEAEMLAAVRLAAAAAGEPGEQAFVFIHGYNTTFEWALYRTAQIAYDVAGGGKPFGTAFMFSWPSGGSLQSYLYDGESAQQSAERLQQFLALVLERAGVRNVHLIAHSMGARPLLAVLDDYARRSAGPRTINQIVLASPDVDAGQFARVAQRIARLARGVTLYASANDLALAASRRLHGGGRRAGDVPTGGPVIVAGVDSIDVSEIGTSVLGIGHAEYVDRSELLADIALLMRKGERPPDRRLPVLHRKVTTDRGTYWRVQR